MSIWYAVLPCQPFTLLLAKCCSSLSLTPLDPQLCRTFGTTGSCPYGARCRFIHAAGNPGTPGGCSTPGCGGYGSDVTGMGGGGMGAPPSPMGGGMGGMGASPAPGSAGDRAANNIWSKVWLTCIHVCEALLTLWWTRAS